MNVEQVSVAPDCENCGSGNTWGKQKLSRYDKPDDHISSYDYPEANCFCKNCRAEFFVPPNWFLMDDWREKAELF